MRHLPLYPRLPHLPVEDGERLPLNSGCTRCELHAAAKTVCMGPQGEVARDASAGTLLVVGERPGADEDKQGSPFVGPTGAYARPLIRDLWPGAIVYDNAVRCLPGKDQKITPQRVEACRPYLRAVLRAVKPSRVLALGGVAVEALTGRSPAVTGVRRGYAHLVDLGAPVFFLLHPAAALRNRFIRSWFQADLAWALSADPEPAPIDETFAVIETPTDAHFAAASVRSAGGCTWDVETVGIAHTSTPVRVVSVSLTPFGTDTAFVWNEDSLADRERLQPLLDLLADPAVPKVAQNGKYDVISVGQTWAVEVRGVVGDTMLLSRLRRPDAESSLEVLEEQVGMGGAKDEAREATREATTRGRKLLDARTSPQRTLFKVDHDPLPRALTREDFDARPGAFTMALIDRDLRDRYNARDTVATERLRRTLTPRVESDEGLRQTWNELLAPAMETIVRMETWGIGVDVDAVRAFSSYLAIQRDEALARIRVYGPRLNPEAHNDVRRLLYEELKLHPPAGSIDRDTNIPSVDKDTLKLLRGHHPVVQAILDYRRFARLDAVYASGMLPFVRPDGRVHPSINVAIAKTGRMSITEPPLQTLPRVVDEEGHTEGKMARDCFIAGWEALQRHVVRIDGVPYGPKDRACAPFHDYIPPGEETIILGLDYSQIELRVLADLSCDEKMLAVFKAGEDLHGRTASTALAKLFGVDCSKGVPKWLRDVAKIVNFSLVYGKGDAALAADLTPKVKRRVTAEEAGEVRAAILGEFSGARDWMQDRLKQARMTGHAETYWRDLVAQRRSLHHIGDPDGEDKGTHERSSWNTPVQGTAWLYCLASLNALTRDIVREKLPAKTVLCVHDQLVFEVAKSYAREFAARAQRVMKSWPTRSGVPLAVDPEWGHSFGSLEKLDLGTA